MKKKEPQKGDDDVLYKKAIMLLFDKLTCF